jgi:1,2-diacylglycerol 3-beta-galactosyltransferase
VTQPNTGARGARVLIAFSDTGGGHRAAATALQRALGRVSSTVSVSVVDPYAMSGRWPFNRLRGAYPRVVGHASWLWHLGFRITNTRWCTALAQTAAWPLLRATFRTLRREYQPDVVVSTHPLLSAPLRRVFSDVPLAVVVTDLVSGHVSWYHRDARLVVTATDAARTHAIAHGVAAPRTAVLGLPIEPPDETDVSSRRARAAALGWRSDRPTILLIGGGDGVGPLEALATAIDAARLPCDLAIVAGRNAALAQRLQQRAWQGIVHCYGFVTNLSAMMHAAEAVLTKAGPGTICEAFAAGCPLVLFAAIPGQETGNVDVVRTSGAGVWAPSTAEVLAALSTWFVGADAAQRRAKAARAASASARPHASADIAARILALAERARSEWS